MHQQLKFILYVISYHASEITIFAQKSELLEVWPSTAAQVNFNLF